MNNLSLEKGDLVKVRAENDIYEVLDENIKYLHGNSKRAGWWILINLTSKAIFDVHEEVIIPITEKGTKVAIHTGIL